MSRRARAMVAVGGAAILCLSLFTAGVVGKPKDQRVGTSTQVETSKIVKGKKSVIVTGELQSGDPRCERQRSVLLYEAGPTGDFRGGAIGHGVSQGGAQRGQFTITGIAPKKITPNRKFRLEAVGRTVKVKGVQIICKRGVSVLFPGNFNQP
jgi:hypothetical protein